MVTEGAEAQDDLIRLTRNRVAGLKSSSQPSDDALILTEGVGRSKGLFSPWGSFCLRFTRVF